jgi:superfamily II DNA/RNA helicase
MYNNNNRRSSGGFQKSSNFGSFNRFGGGSAQPKQWGNKNPGRGRRGEFCKHINPALYVKKAEEFTTIEETTTVNTFQDFQLMPTLMKNILAKGYTKPTLIQDQVIGPILDGKDILGIAATGTGKTAAFAIPLINQILENPRKRIIILAPTRELAVQIKEEFRSFTPGLKVYIALAIGGTFIREQIEDIRRGPNVIIGTPGRIKDLSERRVINFGIFDTLVLDEVDRMLDMGFVNDIRFIVEKIPETRQTLFFSATIDRKIEALIDTFLTDPIKITVKTQEASSHVEQDVVRVNGGSKEEILHDLLRKDDFKKVLVFGSTKRTVDKLTTLLIQRGFSADSIHGDKPQNKRQRVIKAFKVNQISILIATDVAARGLDIADITHVINYDQPNNYEDYIHRIGRTGRGNSKGFALTFIG